MTELAKQYDPNTVEPEITARWLDAKAFAANPDQRDERYVVMMPPPNVTGALHMGHAMGNVMQDLLTRWHRMRGDNTLWLAGTDHAGIATQSVVEKRLFELEGKTRHDVGREALVGRIFEWKDQYQARIVEQQQAMGCGCDWDRQRFTMDAVCARAVRHTFFRLFRDGLIYQGDRLVNWDCHLQTAVADDELYKQTVQGHFWHLRYPVIDPQPGEPEHIVVATTRPETMLGDTAVACHPDPGGQLDKVIALADERLAAAPAKDKDAIKAEIERLEARRTSHVPLLETIAKMARDGRQLRLPLQDRPIPLILDEWPKPDLGSGCVKITPGHDPNDYEVWQRHKDHIEIRNILEPDGTLGSIAGEGYAGLDRFDARKKVVADLDAAGLLHEVEERSIEIDHSDRSKTIIEPYLSKQWFVRMADVEGGIVCGAGTDREFKAPGLAQLGIDATSGEWKSASGRQVRFWPDQDRYHKIYESWLVEKRDWCISRQLWWGHRIPVWHGEFGGDQLVAVSGMIAGALARDDVAAWAVLADETRVSAAEVLDLAQANDPRCSTVRVLVCFRDESAEQNVAPMLEGAGMSLDPDVLDTWFSSGIWPHSTLGWPDPATAPIDPGQTPLGAHGSNPDCLDYFYPGSCLVTGRDIITLWVARMVVLGLYNVGDVPFTDVFLHASILDGRGERMSKSKGNGVDPMNIIDRYGADAMRFSLCEMQTGTQDIRLPVQAISPFDGEPIDLTHARQSSKQGVWIDPKTGKEFDVVGLYADEGIPGAKAVSDRFEVGRNFCNKLWNGGRFALMNLEGVSFQPRSTDELAAEDRWILSRLDRAVEAVNHSLEAYNPSAAIGAAREFFWNDLCDWYLELIKPRIRSEQDAPLARQVLATVFDTSLRLLHPFVPFVTEALWSGLAELAPERGVTSPLEIAPLCCQAAWPVTASARDERLEQDFDLVQECVTRIREVRARYQVPPSQPLEVTARASGSQAEVLTRLDGLIRHMSGTGGLTVDADAGKPQDAALAVVGGIELLVHGVVDVEKEKAKLTKERGKLEGRITGLEKKLSNEGFIAKAPPEVVEKSRGELEGLRDQMRRIDESLAGL